MAEMKEKKKEFYWEEEEVGVTLRSAERRDETRRNDTWTDNPDASGCLGAVSAGLPPPITGLVVS